MVTSNPTCRLAHLHALAICLDPSQQIMLAIDCLPLDLANRIARRGPCRTRCLQRDDRAADPQRIVDAAVSAFSRMQRFQAITAL